MSYITNSRRRFIKSSLAGIAATGFHKQLVASESNGPNDVIRIGVIGTGNRARQLMAQLPDAARIAAICDCYEQRVTETNQKFDAKWPTHADYRELLDRDDVDAVIIATPDHGRSLPCVLACMAGKDVYAEKPLTAYVSEGRRVVEAARKHQRVFQVGTQQRTMEINEHCCRFIRDGRLGKINLVQAMKYPGPRRYGGLPEQPIPPGNDWDRWQGPVTSRPFNSALQFGWMQWRAYSGGEMTNWGAHGVDQIQWALGKSLTGPVELEPITPGPNGAVAARYADGIEVRFELDQGPMGGAVFHGEKGKLEINRNRFASNPADLVDDAPDPAVQKKWELPGWIAGPHLRNWLDCIRTRSRPNADVEVGHRSVSFCHLVNITREVGQKLRWNPDLERFEGNGDANERLTRPRRSGWELPV